MLDSPQRKMCSPITINVGVFRSNGICGILKKANGELAHVENCVTFLIQIKAARSCKSVSMFGYKSNQRCNGDVYEFYHRDVQIFGEKNYQFRHEISPISLRVCVFPINHGMFIAPLRVRIYFCSIRVN